MSENTTKNLINHVRGQVNGEYKAADLYAAYVIENSVTAENVGEHVKALTAAAYPGVKSDSRAESGSKAYKAHTFGCKIRKGLKTALGIEGSKNDKVALITTLGANSPLDAVIAAWHAAQK